MVDPGSPHIAAAASALGRRARRGGRLTPLLILGAYVLALAQRTGETIADTKLALYVAPHRFLHDVLDVWSPTGTLIATTCCDKSRKHLKAMGPR